MRAAAGAAGGGGLSSIMDVTLAAAAAQVDTDTELGGDIPQTFANLLLVVNGKLSSGVFGGNNTPIYARCNNIGTNTYANGDVENSGVAAATGFEENSSALGLGLGSVAGPVAGAGPAGTCVAFFANYTGTTFYKQVVSCSFSRKVLTTGTWSARFGGGFWASTAAITRLQIRSPDTANYTFDAGSRFTLYGLG